MMTTTPVEDAAMPVTYSSSITSEVMIGSGAPESSDGYELVTWTSDASAAMGEITDQASDGTGVTAAVDATAFGTDTLAAVAGGVAVVDGGATTTTSVDLEAVAAAQSSDDLAFASTAIDVAYFGGNGSFISVSHDSTSLEIAGTETTALSFSSAALVVIALDESGFAGTTTSDVPESSTDDAPAIDTGPDDEGCCVEDDGDYGFDLDGNLASFDVGVLAAGENSYADLAVDAFALADSMSSVTLVMTAIID
jgi:hypothetical protein